MPPKKREKDPEASKTANIQTENDMFLQVFEKPTQIYRYLRARNLLSPIFLNRTLSYMKKRMSRNNKARQGFKVDTLLEKVIQRKRNETEPNHANEYMTLTFLGFYDKALENPRDYQVKVETMLLKICHKKRKDSSSAVIEVSVGNCSVPLNPSNSEPPAMASAVSIASDIFSPSQGSDVKSYMLLLQVTITHLQHTNGISNAELATTEGDEPVQKRLKSSSLDQQLAQNSQLEKHSKIYGSELVVYDKHNRCLLTNGEYDVVMRDGSKLQKSPYISRSPHKALAAQWETIPSETTLPSENNPFEVFKVKPVLKLKLSWSQEPTNGLVNRPSTFQRPQHGLFPDKADVMSNKENDRPSGSLFQKNCSDSKKAQSLENGTQEGTFNHDHPVVTYHFLYNNNTKRQVETIEDLHCPWCSLDCGTLYILLKHLKLCHARFSFVYSPVPGAARIEVSINERFDGSYAGAPHDLLGCPRAGARPRAGPLRRAPVTRILCAPRRPRRSAQPLAEFLREPDDEPDSQRPYISGHNRLYHHTITCLPVYPKELDVDSEGETDPLWLQQKTMMMIDEFTDVNEGEKELMKMWNLHNMKYNLVGDCQVPLACQTFLQERGRELLRKNLYRNFILHMCSLHDFGLIAPPAVHQTIQMLNQTLADDAQAKEAMRRNISLQAQHWAEVGKHRQAAGDAEPAGQPESSPAARRKTADDRKAQDTPLRRKSMGNVAPQFRKSSMMVERKNSA